jgi:hypothetical protein
MSLDYQLPTKHSYIDAVCLTGDNLLCQTQTTLRLSFIVEFVFELSDQYLLLATAILSFSQTLSSVNTDNK